MVLLYRESAFSFLSSGSRNLRAKLPGIGIGPAWFHRFWLREQEKKTAGKSQRPIIAGQSIIEPLTQSPAAGGRKRLDSSPVANGRERARPRVSEGGRRQSRAGCSWQSRREATERSGLVCFRLGQTQARTCCFKSVQLWFSSWLKGGSRELGSLATLLPPEGPAARVMGGASGSVAGRAGQGRAVHERWHNQVRL